MMKLITICKYELKYPYYVTDDGHVWSELSQKYISEHPDKYGYMKVRISSTDLPPGKQHAYSVHRLVLENFNPVEGMDKLQVNHIDGDKTNNALSNLEWATSEENIAHAAATGLYPNKNPMAVLTEEQVLDICERLKNGETCVKIAADYDVCRATIERIRNGKSWAYLTKDMDFLKLRSKTKNKDKCS